MTTLSEKKGPLVSVVVPVFNGEATIQNTLTSIQRQTYSNLQVIVVNDGSTDRTASIIEAFPKKDNRFTVVYQENAGLAKARNCGLRYVIGEFITYVDADDCLTADGIALMVESALTQPIPAIIVLGVTEVHEGEEGKLVPRHFPVSGLYNPVSFEAAFATCEVWGKLYPKNLLKNLHFPDSMTQKSQGEDIAYLLQALSIVDAVYFDDRSPVYLYRIASTSMSRGASRLKRFLGLWDCALALYDARDRLKSPSFFREFMIRDILPFLKGLYYLPDISKAVSTMNTQVGKQCWKQVCDVPEGYEDSNGRQPLTAVEVRLCRCLANKSSCVFLTIYTFLCNWLSRLKNHFLKA